MHLFRLIVAATCLFVTTASAQQPATPQSGQASFIAFFKPLIGTWPVHVYEVDAAGKVEYETTQLREFRFTIGGRFVRETAFVRSSTGNPVEMGIHLYGYDAATDRVLLHGFWSGSGDRLTFGPHRIEGDGKTAKLRGTLIVTEADGQTDTTPSIMGFEGDRFVWKTIGTRPDGTTYVDHTLTYSIVPVETMSAR